MRVVVVENTAENLNNLIATLKQVEPTAIVKGFTDGNEALKWCSENSFCVDWFIGNWWGTEEDFSTPEGTSVANLVEWHKEPKKVFVADDKMFEPWSYKEGAVAFLQRPVTLEKVKQVFSS